MKLKKVHKHIYHVLFNTQKEMCDCLFRFSEFHENPVFKNRIFSLEEFKEWYKKFHKKKIYTYSKDWDGFNSSGEVLLEFRKLFNTIFSKQEVDFLNLFKHLSDSQLKKIYVISTCKQSQKTTYLHEMVHAYYNINTDYYKKVNKIISSYRHVDIIFKCLSGFGYDSNVLWDEANAYLVEDYRFLERKSKVEKDTFKAVSLQLVDLYNFYVSNE